MLQVQNSHADALATLSSNIDILEGDMGISIIKRTLRANANELVLADIIDEWEWRVPS